jgi:hypothetical protein
MRVSVLPVMTVMIVIAGAVGLQIGESAIGQIDPLYFQGSAPTPVDVTRNGRAAPAPGYAQASGFAEGFAARAEDCAGCDVRPGAAAQPSYRGEVLPDVSPTLAPPRAETIAAIVDEEAPVQRSAESERVRRYIDYPVTDDQARIRAALDAAAAESATVGR